eukprot:8354979-Heterocapsa_arctica.AAC.1
MESGCRMSGMPLIKSAIVLMMSSLLVPFAKAPTVSVRPSTVDGLEVEEDAEALADGLPNLLTLTAPA